MKFFLISIVIFIAASANAQEITPAFITYVENTCGEKFEKVWKKKKVHIVKDGEYKIYQKYNGTDWIKYLPKPGDQMLFYKDNYFFSISDNAFIAKVKSNKKALKQPKTPEEVQREKQIFREAAQELSPVVYVIKDKIFRAIAGN